MRKDDPTCCGYLLCWNHRYVPFGEPYHLAMCILLLAYTLNQFKIKWGDAVGWARPAESLELFQRNALWHALEGSFAVRGSSPCQWFFASSCHGSSPVESEAQPAELRKSDRNRGPELAIRVEGG